MTAHSLVWLQEVGKDDGKIVGGKGANLGEMVKAHFPVPPGFVVTAEAYATFLQHNGLNDKIQHVLETIDFSKPASLEKASLHIKKFITSGFLPESFVKDVFQAYIKLGHALANPFVAVRSSATAEDLADASFAGQQESFLNIQGEANLLLAIKDVWASLFDTRAIFYRHEKGFDHLRVRIAVVVQKMINAKKSGVMFTLNPVTNDKTTIVVEAINGLGEYIVQGEVTPDHYEVDKQSLTLITKHPAQQAKQLVRKGNKNVNEKLLPEVGKKQKISDEQIIKLATLGKKVEQHYYFPQDIEWAIEDNAIYLVQTRPVTTTKNMIKQKETMQKDLPIILKGDPTSPGIASGTVRIVPSAKDIGRVQLGDVLVTMQTNPDFVPAMKKAAAIVTDTGGRTSHAAIIARELGIPAVVGTQKATKVLQENDVITVNGTTGEIAKGKTIHTINAEIAEPYQQTATKIYVNLAQPELAEKIAKRYVDGVGLLRAEFIMADIDIHPKKAIQEQRQEEYIQKLAAGIGTFCQAFSPRPVVYRTSDFKTNEYRHLKGGEAFENIEPNPMLGYRGTFRYVHNPEVFELELAATKQVRHKMKLKNLWMMLPFVRSIDELVAVKKLIASAGLYRTPSFKIWMMIEIPSNVILLDQFIEVGIDGISIGSNDLTMLLLGVDRDNNDVAEAFQEENEAVLWAFEKIIKTAHKHNITVSFCGQAVSQYPNLVEKLVRWGITSISVSPDALLATRNIVSAAELKLVQNT